MGLLLLKKYETSVNLSAPIIQLNPADDWGNSDSDYFTANNTPRFFTDFVEDSFPEAGDKLQWYVDGVAHGAEHTISPEEILAGEIDISLSALEDGVNGVTLVHSRGSSSSDPSNEEVLTIDTSVREAPTLAFGSGLDETDIPTTIRASFTDAIENDAIYLTETVSDGLIESSVLDSTDVSNGYYDFTFTSLLGEKSFIANIDTEAGTTSENSNAIEYELLNTYSTTTTRFDGNDGLRRVSALTGISNSESGTFVTWFDFKGGNGTYQPIFIAGQYRFQIYKWEDNTLGVLFNPDGGTNDRQLVGLNSYTDSSGLGCLMVSWNPTTIQMYVGDVSENGTLSPNISRAMAWDTWETRIAMDMNANPASADKSDLELGDLRLWVGTYLDLSQTENRRRFIDSSGNPVQPARDGMPTPNVLLSNSSASFHLNNGSGGDYTVFAGSLSAGTTIP